jgi:hypothetical protein
LVVNMFPIMYTTKTINYKDGQHVHNQNN